MFKNVFQILYDIIIKDKFKIFNVGVLKLFVSKGYVLSWNREHIVCISMLTISTPGTYPLDNDSCNGV